MNTKNIKKEIVVAGIDILLLKKEIKNFHLNVLPPDGHVRVSVPLNTDEKTVLLFIIKRMSWIKKQIEKFKSQARQTSRKYISGESHYFKGNRYILNIIDSIDTPKIVIRNKKYLDFYVDTKLNTMEKEAIMDSWYRSNLEKDAEKIISKWEKKFKLNNIDYSIKKMKTKWGSCNPIKNSIVLNLELSKKTKQSLEYIIVHELTHFFEKKHNDNFINLMNKQMPKWRIYKEELNSDILSEY